MLYIVRSRDTLFRICQRYRTTMAALMKANLICNPRFAISGNLIQIVGEGTDIPRLGINPYYILLPGDSLECIAHYSKVSVTNLLRDNSIHNIRRLGAGTELLIWGQRPDPDVLYDTWATSPRNNQLTEEQKDKYHQETFAWQALRGKAVAPLIRLLEHTCPEVRYYAILSLGRLGLDRGAISALEKIYEDRYRENRKLAKLAIDRVALVQQGYRRTRLLIKADKLLDDLNRLAPAATPLVEGTGIMVLKWHVPVASAAEGKPDFLTYDYVMVVASGQKGFLLRPHGKLNLI